MPALNSGNQYHTATDAGGTALKAGDIISTTQTIFIYAGTVGCSDESSFNVTIDPPSCKETAEIKLPKFFTPNGDGYNDVWDISSLLDVNAQILIFDRYGKLIAQLNSRNSLGWDGNYNGQPLPTDGYWYRVIIDSQREIKGFFTLKR